MILIVYIFININYFSLSVWMKSPLWSKSFQIVEFAHIEQILSTNLQFSNNIIN